jgi:hypothetical protein
MAVMISEAMLSKNQRKCRSCKQTKSIKYFIKKLRPGLRWMPSDCLECEKKRQQARRKIHKTEEYHHPRPERCEVCNAQRCNGKKGRKRVRICYDHCHLSGLFRGWLCDDCNHILGLAKDDPQRLRKLARYLAKFFQSDKVLRLLK